MESSEFVHFLISLIYTLPIFSFIFMHAADVRLSILQAIPHHSKTLRVFLCWHVCFGCASACYVRRMR